MVTLRSRSRRGGYTLIEVACAFAVLSILATGIMLGEGRGIRTVAKSFRETSALQLAAGRLDELAAPGAVRTPGKTRFDLDPEAVELLSHPRAYQVVHELEPGLLEVTAEVSWMDTRAGRRQRVTLTTLIAEDPQ